MTAGRASIVAHGLRGVELVAEPVPPLRATEVAIDVRYSLVSPGTERHYVEQLRGRDASLALGYCVAGRARACGAEVRDVAPGDAVIAMGWQLAIHASHVVVPMRLVVRVPDGLALALAVLAPLAATAVHAVDRARLTADERVLVVGLGPVGVLVAMVAHAVGARVAAWDLDPEAVGAQAFWTALDPAHPPRDAVGALTAAFLCIDAEATALIAQLQALLSPTGAPHQRARIVNVGRARAQLTLDPAAGNLDIINASRCGAGYRDDDYHHGRRSVPVVAGEHTVDANLRRSVALVARYATELAGLPRRIHAPREALALYNAPGGFAPGIHLIDHGDRHD